MRMRFSAGNFVQSAPSIPEAYDSANRKSGTCYWISVKCPCSKAQYMHTCYIDNYLK